MEAFHLFVYVLFCSVFTIESKPKGGCNSNTTYTSSSSLMFSHDGQGSSDYRNDLNCSYEIIAPRNLTVFIKFMQFDIEPSKNCTFDYVIIYSKATPNNQTRMCGSRVPQPIQMPLSPVIVQFHSDTSSVAGGFRLQYSFIAKKKETPRKCGLANMGIRDTLEDSFTRLSTQLSALRGRRPIILRVVGGSRAKPGKWPWLVSLTFMGDHNCGASILSHRWLLTAAHCFRRRSMKEPRAWRAIIGEFNTHIREPQERRMQIDKILLHPSFRDHNYDVALLRLKHHIDYSRYAAPVCLPAPVGTMRSRSRRKRRTIDDQLGKLRSEDCFISGWGNTRGTAKSNLQQELRVPILNTARCNSSSMLNGELTDNMFCAGYEQGGRDSCQGDSGGPLFCRQADASWTQVGIVSWGRGCAQANKPGVYTKVINVQGWISKVIEDYE